MHTSCFKTPFGEFEAMHDEQRLYQALFSNVQPFGQIAPTGMASPQIQQISGEKSLFSQKIATELTFYFKNPRYRFQLPLKPQGSHFQQRVWHALLVIPSGQTITYGKLATQLQSSPRAIGQACKRNPLTLFIPCHRVVGKQTIGGYMGCEQALGYKQALLKHEGFLHTSEQQSISPATILDEYA